MDILLSSQDIARQNRLNKEKKNLNNQLFQLIEVKTMTMPYT